MEKGKIMI